jgi:hypothetical protein
VTLAHAIHKTTTAEKPAPRKKYCFRGFKLSLLLQHSKFLYHIDRKASWVGQLELSGKQILLD